MKLSKDQESALRLACSTHGVTCAAQTAIALEKRGLVRRVPSFWGGHEIIPTEAGRQAMRGREVSVGTQALEG